MARRKKQRSTYLLKEPNWKELSLLTEPADRKKAISNSEYFVHYEIPTKQKQDAMIKWIKQDSGWDKEEIKLIVSIDKGYFSSMGKTVWTSKKLGYWPEGMIEYVNEKCKPHWLKLGKKYYIEKKENPKEKTTKVISIQQRMREQVSSLCGAWEGLLDSFVENESFLLKDFDPYNDMRAYQPSIKPAHAKIIKDLYTSELQEAKEVMDWNDPDIKEGYSHFTPKMRKDNLAFFEKIQTACDTLIDTGKAKRKPRKPKPINREKLIQKLKYQINESDLGIASINPIDIIDASELWVYNTKLRKLGVYKKSELSIGLTVKGTSIKDFNTETSFQKTLRKPAEQIREIKNSAKMKFNSYFEDIKTTPTKLSGRINDTTILLKVF